MADVATMQTRIDAIDEILAKGVRSTMVGDVRVEYDLEALRAERTKLQRTIASRSSSNFRRVVFKHG